MPLQIHATTKVTCCPVLCEKQQQNPHQIVSMYQWLNNNSSTTTTTEERETAATPLPLVDLRRSLEYCKRRFVSSSDTATATQIVVVNLPFESLLEGQRSCELPPRNISFAILVPCNYYNDDGDNNVTLDPQLFDFFYATQSKATKKSRVQWKIEQVLLEDDSLWAEAKQIGMLLLGDDDDENNSSNHCLRKRIAPQPRLWEPDPFVKYDLCPLLVEELSQAGTMSEVWDLGSGAGRDICFLAESVLALRLPTVKFVGIDNHKGSSSRCIPFWERRLQQVSSTTEGVVVTTKQLNLNKISLFHEYLASYSSVVKMCYCVRFMNRNLLHYFACSNDTLPSGAIFAITHFCKEAAGALWKYDHPSEKNVLERDELKTLFLTSPIKWIILKNSICYDGDHGRTMIQFIARRV